MSPGVARSTAAELGAASSSRATAKASKGSPPMTFGLPSTSCARRKKEVGSPATALCRPAPSATHAGACAAEGSTVTVSGEPAMGIALHVTAS